MLILKDDGYGTTVESLRFFRKCRDYLGEILSVEMIYYYKDEEWVEYPLHIIGSLAEMRLSGCNSGFGGEGPHGSVTVLRELGYPEPYCEYPLQRKSFLLGDPKSYE